MRQALPPRRPRTKSTTSDNALSRRNRTNTKASGSSSVNAILKMDGDRPQINTTKSSPRSVERDVLQRFSRPLSEQSALRERIPAEGIIRVAHRYCKPLQELLLDLLALQRLLRAALRRDGGTQLNHRICVPVC